MKDSIGACCFPCMNNNNFKIQLAKSSSKHRFKACRFHARGQASFDVRGTSIGFLIYMGTALSLARQENASVFAVLVPFGLGSICLWPLLSLYRPQMYYKYRDIGWIIHFFLHHVYAPEILMSLGVDLKEPMASDNPVGFFLSSLISGTLVWHTLDVLMYRMKLSTFCLAQPFILLGVTPLDLRFCAWAASEHPANAAVTYQALSEYGQTLGAFVPPPLIFKDFSTLSPSSSSSLFSNHSSSSSSSNEIVVSPPLMIHQCHHVHLFMMYLWGYILPIFIISKLERQTWQAFLNAPVETLMWTDDGGPTAAEIEVGMHELRDKEHWWASSEDSVPVCLAVLVIAAGTLWRAVELVIGS